jgi:hypothetical protein
MREYLAEFSTVSDGGTTGPRDVLSTRLEPHPEVGRAILIYQRSTYAGASSNTLETQQVIQYTIRFDDIDAKSVATQTWKGFNSGREFRLVRAVILEGAEFIAYTNVFERRLADGTVDVTSSRGNVREVVLGYFDSESNASRFADTFRGILEDLSA